MNVIKVVGLVLALGGLTAISGCRNFDKERMKQNMEIVKSNTRPDEFQKIDSKISRTAGLKSHNYFEKESYKHIAWENCADSIKNGKVKKAVLDSIKRVLK
ncbi:MAG: hypothetical protein WCY19_02535 [Candidatus Gastranaerophilaceae bacterium]